MNESLDDFKRKYKYTYVFLTVEKKKHLVHFVDTVGTGDKVRFLFESPNFGDILVDEKTVEETIELRYPKQGLYNIAGEAALFYRLPERQWKRAPCASNSRIQNMLASIQYKAMNINWDNLDAIYTADYPSSIDVAIEHMKYSIALNLNFGISVTNTEKKNEYLLWYKSNPIGYLYKDTKEIHVYTPFFYQEVLDLCKYKENQWIPKLKTL